MSLTEHLTAEQKKVIEEVAKTGRGVISEDDLSTPAGLLEAIRAAYRDMRQGRLTLDEARNAIRFYKVITKVWEEAMEHARLTGRLAKGSRKLPMFDPEG